MPVVPKSFSYAQKKYPSEARNKSGKQLISCNSKRQIIERTEKQNASSRYFNSSRAHHAAEGKFDEPIGSAGNRPQGGLCKPPARPVVMIALAFNLQAPLAPLSGELSAKQTERLLQICDDLSVSASPSHLP